MSASSNSYSMPQRAQRTSMSIWGFPQLVYQFLLYVGDACFGEIPVSCLSRSSGLLRYARDDNSRGSKEPTMKRAVITCLLTLVALSMTGCPIYPSDNLCHSQWDCAPGYTCDEVTGACLAVTSGCTRPADCTGQSETCTSGGICQIGSCKQLGCVAGYSCGVVDSTWSCVAGAGSPGIGGATGLGGSTHIGGGSATGGSATTTGGSSQAGGGTLSLGGANGTGGLTGSGGLTASGGVTSLGGAGPTSGGTPSIGGTSASGGAAAAGGSKATGGTATTSGGLGTGGST
jgi:hypothetical protein